MNNYGNKERNAITRYPTNTGQCAKRKDYASDTTRKNRQKSDTPGTHATTNTGGTATANTTSSKKHGNQDEDFTTKTA